MNQVPEELLPPPIIRAYLKRQATLPVSVVTRKRAEVPYHVHCSTADTRAVERWIDAMNHALMGTVKGVGLSTLFDAVWVETPDMPEGEMRIVYDGEAI